MYTETKMPMIMLITILQSIKEMNIIDTHIARNSCVAVEYFTYLVSLIGIDSGESQYPLEIGVLITCYKLLLFKMHILQKGCIKILEQDRNDNFH